jgi:16S rRNA (cytosine967-C5)-methyltransferase
MQTGGESFPRVKEDHFHRYVGYAAVILASYNGKEPLNSYLKKYFSVHRKHGSKDRRVIASLCYDSFRLGHSVSIELPVEERLLLAARVCEAGSFAKYISVPHKAISPVGTLPEKENATGEDPGVNQIFPFPGELSASIDQQAFGRSFLSRPRLFIRLRKGFEARVISKINQSGIQYESLSDKSLAFASTEKVTDVINIDAEAVVQDSNSQRTLDIALPWLQKKDAIIAAWDCCCGSGGKSILAVDLFPGLKLTVTDSRKKILDNLRLRFAKAGITSYSAGVADLQASNALPADMRGPFDLIIADVPCSGSGTWARTPEQLLFFDKSRLDTYAALQRKIVENSVDFLKGGGYYLYITCSVCKKENEDNVAYLQGQGTLELLGMEYLKGYEIQADTLFVAFFRKKA